jgi:hypothetical protein
MVGFLTALGAFILLWKINLIYFCQYHWQTDLLFAVLVAWLFFGTFSGMATAAVAGVVFSGMLYAAKLILDV